MDNVRTGIEGIIRKTVVLGDDQIKELVDHLLSPVIGVRLISDLEDVAVENLPPRMLGDIPAKRLIKAFHIAARVSSPRSRSRSPIRTQSNEGESSNEANTSQSPENVQRTHVFGPDDFTFVINWNDLPIDIVRTLEKAKGNEDGKFDSYIRELKLAIAEKALINYSDYRKTHPSAQKSPGIHVSNDIARQVVAKIPDVMKEKLNTVYHGSGQETFGRRLNTTFENTTRTKPGSTVIPSVSRGGGVLGVLKDQYQPALSRKERNRQVVIHASLIRIAESNPDDWDWPEIGIKMRDTFDLQRDQIVELKEKIMVDNQDEQEEIDADDVPEQRAMSVMKKDWPLLFYSAPMNAHFKRLTGIDLNERVLRYLAGDHLKYLTLFLCSCASSATINTQNLALQLKLEDDAGTGLSSMSVGTKFLLAFCMIANNFKETYANTFLLKAERTLTPEEVESVPELPTSICIIALGSNPFIAHKYMVTVDKVCVAEKTNAMDAIMMAIQICFIFDIEYPEGLPLTFEYVERIVLEMTTDVTRIKNKKGKVLMVLTEKIKKTEKAILMFKNQINNAIEADF